MAKTGGVLNDGKLNERCTEGAPNTKMRVPFADGKSADGSRLPGLPDIAENKYRWTGGKVNQ